MSEDEESFDLFARAFEEIEKGELEKGVWAKAYSQTDSDDAARKLYIQLRVDQLKEAQEDTSLETEPSIQNSLPPDRDEVPNQTRETINPTVVEAQSLISETADPAADHKIMLYLAIAIAVSYVFLNAVGSDSKTPAMGTVWWLLTAWLIYKRQLSVVVAFQKVMLVLQPSAAIFGIFLLNSGTSVWSAYSQSDLLLSAAVSVGLHFWYLTHFNQFFPAESRSFLPILPAERKRDPESHPTFTEVDNRGNAVKAVILFVIYVLVLVVFFGLF